MLVEGKLLIKPKVFILLDLHVARGVVRLIGILEIRAAVVDRLAQVGSAFVAAHILPSPLEVSLGDVGLHRRNLIAAFIDIWSLPFKGGQSPWLPITFD